MKPHGSKSLLCVEELYLLQVPIYLPLLLLLLLLLVQCVVDAQVCVCLRAS